MKQDCCVRAWCRLIRERRWSTRQKFRLLTALETPEAVLAASPGVINTIISRPTKRSSFRVPDAELDRDLAWLDKPNQYLITLHSNAYPEALKNIPDPPIGLFAMGDLGLLKEPCIAMVGARRPTPIGARVAETIAKDLAEMGIVIVSGLALGIDGIAHRSTLNANGGSIAVLGSGLDLMSPLRHKAEFEDIARSGLVLSEYPLGYAATKYTFPERNRIVSGLSLGVIIVEAAERSGTLITARHALEQDRELMVVPGSALSAQYQGSHRLIQQGAALVVNAPHVLDCLATELSAFIGRSTLEPSDLPNQTCSPLLQHIGASSTSIDQLILASGLTPTEVSSMLITLEMEGAVAIEADGGYVNLT